MKRTITAQRYTRRGYGVGVLMYNCSFESRGMLWMHDAIPLCPVQHRMENECYHRGNTSFRKTILVGMLRMAYPARRYSENCHPID
jgi:hypothetical protein